MPKKSAKKTEEVVATAAVVVEAKPEVVETKTEAVEVEVNDKPSDFLMFIGETFYTKEDFINEAQNQGISKRLPSFHLPTDLKVGASRIWLASSGNRKSGAEGTPTAEIFGFFTPTAIEFIAGPDGEKTYADIISAVKKLDGSRIVADISKEAERKCGKRKVGGTYLVTQAQDATTPSLQIIDPIVQFQGNHFRGMMRLSDEQRDLIEKRQPLNTLHQEECMVCFEKMFTSKDSVTRAARERNRMEKGEAPKWILKCPACTKADRDAKRAAKEAAAMAGVHVEVPEALPYVLEGA